MLIQVKLEMHGDYKTKDKRMEYKHHALVDETE